MRMIILIVSLTCLSLIYLYALTPIRTKYEKESDIRAEFLNLYLGKQDKGFQVIKSTPRYQDLEEFNPVLFSSGTNNKFLIRIGTEIFKIQLSSN